MGKVLWRSSSPPHTAESGGRMLRAVSSSPTFQRGWNIPAFGHPHCKKKNLMFKWNFLHFNLFPLSLLCHWPPLRRAWLSLLHSLPSGVYIPSCLQARNSLSLCIKCSEALTLTSRPFTGHAPVCPSLSYTREPRTGPNRSDVSPGLSRGEGSSPSTSV